MADTNKALTVAQLIERLKEMPQDAPVLIEGCDCLGDAGGVKQFRLDPGLVEEALHLGLITGDEVLITRRA